MILIITSILFIIVILLCWHNYHISRAHEATVISLRKQLFDLGSELKPKVFENIDPSRFKPEMRLTVKIKDPITLAKREDKMARLIADFMPSLIVRKVYEQVKDEVSQGLIDKQVEAEVEIEVTAICLTEGT
jgi:hypothetical protein